MNAAVPRYFAMSHTQMLLLFPSLDSKAGAVLKRKEDRGNAA